MTDNDLNERLRAWGNEPTPPIDGAFANRLEVDLRVRATNPDRRRPWFSLLLRPSFVAAALLVVAGVVQHLVMIERWLLPLA